MVEPVSRQTNPESSNPISLEQALKELEEAKTSEKQLTEEIKQLEAQRILSEQEKTQLVAERLYGGLDHEQKNLRLHNPVLETSAMTALTHYFGGQLVNANHITSIYCQLERDIKEASKSNQTVPILFEYYDYVGSWDEPDIKMFNTLVTINPKDAIECFIATAEEKQTSSHAFTSDSIWITEASLKIKGTYITNHKHITDVNPRIQETRADFALEHKTNADQPRINYGSAYTYSDQRSSCVRNIRDTVHCVDHHQAEFRHSVGWKAIEKRFAELSEEQRLPAIVNLYKMFEGLETLECKVLNFNSQASTLQKLLADYHKLVTLRTQFTFDVNLIN